MVTTYKDAGVDIAAGQALVDNIAPLAQATHSPSVLSGLGGFGGLFDLSGHTYAAPVLVSSTDGVGTKLKLALEAHAYHAIGIDVVAMCVNDIITCGAKPLFFLDYYATRQLRVDVATAVIAGIAQGCKQSGAALLGGETAEMPGVYQDDDIDVAGFCVGIAEKSQLLTPEHITPGNVLIGLPASGPHANGFSLIRHILTKKQVNLQQHIADKPLIEHLLAPTCIYTRAIQTLCHQRILNGAAHITGGGIVENLPRILPEGLCAHIDTLSWQRPDLFTWLQMQGDISDQEMWRTFNCGVGMVLSVDADHVQQAHAALTQCHQPAWVIGHIARQQSGEPPVIFH